MTEEKRARKGSDAPLRKQRQAFIDAFMPHAVEWLEDGSSHTLRARLRVLLSDAWYDGYIAGERHANSQGILTNTQPDPKD